MGVFCRPGCPSPRPLRRNVRFFRSTTEAEAGGFRACRRCDPKGERAGIARAVVPDSCSFMEAAEHIPSLETLAARAGYSPFHFLRMFRTHTGVTPRSYAERIRRATVACRSRQRRAGGGRGGRGRLWIGEPRLRKDGRAAGHDARCGAARRGGRGDPHRPDRLSVRPPSGRCDRQGRLLRRLRRARRGAARRSLSALFPRAGAP
ncbi:MAG: hypothetical protein M3Y41_03335 [Pseudomonadota bacterium]|nr:hypothetical protein [Pseudomonadota bacterium]